MEKENKEKENKEKENKEKENKEDIRKEPNRLYTVLDENKNKSILENYKK